MSVFYKVLEQIKNEAPNGHAVRNIENIKSLTMAKEEIEEIFTSDDLQKVAKTNDMNYKFDKID